MIPLPHARQGASFQTHFSMAVPVATSYANLSLAKGVRGNGGYGRWKGSARRVFAVTSYRLGRIIGKSAILLIGSIIADSELARVGSETTQTDPVWRGG